MENKENKMSLGARLAYSFGAFGNDAFYGLLSGYLIMFITSHLFNTGSAAQDAKMISMVTFSSNFAGIIYKYGRSISKERRLIFDCFCNLIYHNGYLLFL